MTLPDKMYGHRARIGYTSPPLTTEIFPYEFYKIVPDGVTLVVTSLAIVVRSKDEVDQSYDVSMRAAREMAAAGCDIVCLGGVPINLSRGATNAEQMIVDLEQELGVKVSSSTAAQARAAKMLGCHRSRAGAALCCTTTPRIWWRPMAAISASKFWVRLAGVRPSTRSARIPQHAAVEMGRKLMKQHPDADTILMPSPHWPTAGALDVLEREFGVNVMSAHQAIVWDALRRCGVNDKIEGFGRLFREF